MLSLEGYFTINEINNNFNKNTKILTEKLEIDNNKVNYQNEIDRINNILSSEYATNEDGSFKSMVDNYIIPMLATKDELLIEFMKNFLKCL